MRTVVNILAVSVLLIGGCLSIPPQDSSSGIVRDFTGVDKIAIVAVEGAVTSEAAKDQIADFFSMELLGRGYAPVARAQVRAQLREQEPESEGLTTGEGAVQVGLILDVPAVLTIRIPHFAEQISITAQLINVEDSSTLWLATGSDQGKQASSNLFGFGSKSKSDDQLLSGVMSGPSPLGGPLGVPLTPEQAQRAQAIVKAMCRSLPAKSAEQW